MEFDAARKTLDLSVRDIAFSIKASQSDGYISRRLRARIGQDAHASYQSNTEGETEYYIKFFRQIGDWNVKIRGRVDVVHKNGNSIHIEEVKSAIRNVHTMESDEAHVFQLQLYCLYFYEVEGFSDLSADLVMIDPVNKQERRVKVEVQPVADQLDEFLKKLIKNYVRESKTREKLKERQETVVFPYEYRKFQEDIVEQIEAILPANARIMLHAPPGIGKTITTLYPALKLALSRGQRLFVFFNDTVTTEIYTEAISDLHQAGSEFKAIKITAKAKMCHTRRYDCMDNDCPYLENYFETD
ncbi:MAG: PD-(D/E)XK nuclease family protein, partial [Candidatus Kariarchaeaceae archaeon]